MRRPFRLLTSSFLLLTCGAGFAAAAELDLATATVLDLQEAYDAGLTSERVVEVYLKRIEAYNQAGPKLNAILTLNPRALEIARELDAERKATGPRSPLHGVPFLVKDNYDTFDMPTTGGAKALAGLTPPRDAFTVARLRSAGAIILAKTNLDEFARGATGTSSLGGQVLNPYNLAKIPGGSSGGSAVGVTTLMGWIGLGTETGSSIRNPSTKANLVGFSPSQGLVSRGGIIPISITYDRAGPMTRNVTDAAVAMSVMAGTDAAGFAAADVTDVVLTHLHFDHVGWTTRKGDVVFDFDGGGHGGSLELDQFGSGDIGESKARRSVTSVSGRTRAAHPPPRSRWRRPAPLPGASGRWAAGRSAGR